MAKLHALIAKDDTDRGKHSTTAHRHIQAQLQTWNGRITVRLRKDDTFEILVGPHTSESTSDKLLATGRVNGFDATIQLQGVAPLTDGE